MIFVGWIEVRNPTFQTGLNPTYRKPDFSYGHYLKKSSEQHAAQALEESDLFVSQMVRMAERAFVAEIAILAKSDIHKSSIFNLQFNPAGRQFKRGDFGVGVQFIARKSVDG